NTRRAAPTAAPALAKTTFPAAMSSVARPAADKPCRATVLPARDAAPSGPGSFLASPSAASSDGSIGTGSRRSTGCTLRPGGIGGPDALSRRQHDLETGRWATGCSGPTQGRRTLEEVHVGRGTA